MVGAAALVIPLGIAAIWILDQAAGTGWALPVAAMFGLPLLAVSFKEPRR